MAFAAQSLPGALISTDLELKETQSVTNAWTVQRRAEKSTVFVAPVYTSLHCCRVPDTIHFKKLKPGVQLNPEWLKLGPNANVRFMTPLITQAELLKQIPVSKRTLITWRQKKLIPFYQFGKNGKVFYKLEEVQAAIERGAK